MATDSVKLGSKGVGGLILDNRTGQVIRESRNYRSLPVNAAVATGPNEVFTWDYTAHGETGLVGWYQFYRKKLGLPDPRHLTIVTSLDPCAMCTGSIHTAGFSAAVVAFDATGGHERHGRWPLSDDDAKPASGRLRQLGLLLGRWCSRLFRSRADPASHDLSVRRDCAGVRVRLLQPAHLCLARQRCTAQGRHRFSDQARRRSVSRRHDEEVADGTVHSPYQPHVTKP
ncbi:unannotated protein [freshwater metagenome]|uniref:Unannotated protein n=1 Tax=freshwater metagenome TaxID=449393 RepID=A0A6J7LRP2_9ZZZZ